MKKLTSSLLSEWSEEIFSEIITGAALFIAIISEDKKSIFTNPTFNLNIKTNVLDALINPTFDDLLKIKSDKAKIFSGMITIGDYNSINFSIVASVFRKNGSVLIIGGIDSSQLIEQNKVMHILNRDITGLQRNLIKEKTKLENANQELSRLTSDKDRFISLLAHDLRNPLGTTTAFSEHLIKNFTSFDNEKLIKYLKLIHDTNHKTHLLLEDMLLWLKSGAGKMEPKLYKVSLSEIATSAIADFKTIAESKNIHLNYFEPEETLLFADINMLKAILRNLISNAIKFTGQNGKIEIYPEPGKEVIVTVDDTGTGMTAEEINALWKDHLNNSTTGTFGEKGTGFGLTICKDLVEKMGGKIWVESTPGFGSRFRFTVKTYDH